MLQTWHYICNKRVIDAGIARVEAECAYNRMLPSWPVPLVGKCGRCKDGEQGFSPRIKMEDGI
jgi:hypothetical protein